MKIGILGTGNVGSALGEGWVQRDHEVRFGSRDPDRARVPDGTQALSQIDAVRWAQVVVMAVPYTALENTAKALGPESFEGKVIVDVTNLIAEGGGLAVGHTTSGAEELSRWVPRAKVVKAFNTVFAQNMSRGRVGADPLSLFIASDDAAAKETVSTLGRDLGFEPIDAGPLYSARYLEPMGMQLITLGYGLRMGPGIGYRLLWSGE